MANQPYDRRGVTLVELLVVISIIGVLVALLLPAVQQARESGRTAQCKNHLHQLGLALHAYHDALRTLPPGCVWTSDTPLARQGWGWAALLLPFLEQSTLRDAVSPPDNSLHQVLNSPTLQPFLRTYVDTFHCPSDGGGQRVHDYRLLTGFVYGKSTIAFHPPNSGGTGAGVFGVPTSIANYVGVFGDSWQPNCTYSSIDDLRGNGAFGSNSEVTLSGFSDGLSNTMLVGERSRSSYAAAWVGTDSWDQFDTLGLSMVLGTAYYNVNAPPDPYNLSCNGGGASGFGSRHPNGAMFVMADGSIRFIANTIDSRVSNDVSKIGIYQRLARRNDGQMIGD